MVTAVALFTVLAVLLLWGLSLQLQGQLREQVLARAQMRSQQLADAMAGQTDALLSVLNLGLLDMRANWPGPRENFNAVEQRVLTSLPKDLVSHLTVVDAGGTVVHNSLGTAPGTFVGDRAYFQALRSGGDRLVLGEPVLSRQSGQWLIVVGRPMFKDGQFAGELHLTVSTDFLARTLGRLALSDNDLVGLVHPTGAFLARSLDNASAMGQSIPPDRPFMQDVQANRGTFRMDGSVDGVPRLFGWQRLSGTGAVVVVGLSEASVLAPLEATRRQAQLLTTLVSLALAAIGAWIAYLLGKLLRGRDQVARSEQRLKLAQRMARVGHWAYAPVNQSMTWSDEVFRIFGQEPASFAPSFERYWEQVHPDERDRLGKVFDDALSDRCDLDDVHRIVLPDGTERWVRMICESDPHGHGPAYQGTIQDVTELREAQASLERLNGELEQRVKGRTRELVALNRDLESFTYSVSHDLRTPLRTIHGFATVLAESDAARLSDEGRDALRRIQDGARRMGQLITDLLSMAQQSRAELKVQAVNLSELARSVAVELERGDPSRQAQWLVEDGLWVQADPGLMTVVMQNLLGNAWKYTGRTDRACIELFRLGEADGMLGFCVRDNGAGFDMAYADQLFLPFKRLHHQNEFEGTGVGLASVQRILQRHGGSVRGEGAVGQGATFSFSLPIEPVRQFLDSAPSAR
jgi:PAS domain S-box-containing protein